MAEGRDGSDELLSAPSLAHMSSICRELAPVLFAHLNFGLPEDQFWGHATLVLSKITKITPVPDPMADFQLFVLYLYTFRELLKPANVQDCLVYVNEFCPDPPEGFFVTEFLGAICDPAIAIATYYEMDKTELPLWMKWKEKKGNIERFFDLFVTMIQPGEEVLETVRLLIELLTSMVLENTELVTWEKLAVSLYKAIVAVIEEVHDDRSVHLARCLMAVGEALVSRNSKQMEASVIRMKGLLAEESKYRNFLLYWLSQKVSLFNQSVLVTNLTRPALYSNFVFQLIEDVAPKLTLSNLSTLTTHLAKVMIQKQAWMRRASRTLVHIFTKCKTNDSQKRWFGQYVQGCFMFFRLAFEIKKAQDRVTAWVSVACADFGQIDWIRRHLAKNLVLAVTPETRFLLCMLEGEKPEVPNRELWDEEYAIFFSQHSSEIENLPFKKQSTRLVKLKDKVTKLEDVVIDPEIEKLDISPEFRPFVMIKRGDEDSATKAIYALQDSLDIERERLQDVVRLEEETHSLNIDVSTYELHPPRRLLPWIKGILWCARKITRQILIFQRKTIQKQIDDLMGFIELIKQKPEVKFRHARLLKYFDCQLFNDPAVVRLQTLRATFGVLVQTLEQNYMDPLKNRTVRQEMKQVLDALEPDLEYSPLSVLDEVVEARLPVWFDAKVLKCALVVMEQPCSMPALVTIKGLAETIAKQLKITISNPTMILLRNSVLRYFFEQEYQSGQSLLHGWDDEDCRFLLTCHQRSTARVVSLGMENNVFGKGHLQAVLRTVIKTKGDIFAVVPFLTNPLDILYELHRAFGVVRKAYEAESLAGSDAVKLFYATLVAAPPANCLRVYRLLKKWSPLFATSQLKETLEVFLGAADMVVNPL